MTTQEGVESTEFAPANHWWREPQLLLVILLVAVIYLARLDYLPMVGEEARWARGAVQMIETGDWVVPRQQLQPFPERPPLSSWAMAITGVFRGDVDPIAARLPSVLSVLLTSVLIYAYGRAFLTTLGAATAAGAYATFGQVLQIGRHGESEAMFSLFVSASLLLWHYGYQRRWRPLGVWTAAYACMTLGAYVKGPQAPIYFAAVVGFYLLIVQRDWRYFFHPAHAVGIFTAVILMGVWQAPYYLMTDWDTVSATWGGLARDRFRLVGLLEHIATYPVETFVCLLPWSPLLFTMGSKRFRASLDDIKPWWTFLAVAILVTYPSVLLASHARGRYFMPLYPCFALGVGIVLERTLTSAQGSFARFNLRNCLVGLSVAFLVGAIGLAAISFGVVDIPALADARQPLAFAGFLVVAAIASSAVVWAAIRQTDSRRLGAAAFSLAALVGLVYTGVVINSLNNAWHHPGSGVAELKQLVPEPNKMVSFGPVDFRFCYYYRDQVKQLDWPTDLTAVPENVDYFVISDDPNAKETRLIGRGRTWTSVPAEFPFQWEEVSRVKLDRRKNGGHRTVILGRIKRDDTGRIAARDVARF